MSKLKLDPIVIDENKVDIVLLCLGVAIIGLVLYQAGVFNGATNTGKLIDATNRFGNKGNSPGSGENIPSNPPNGSGDNKQ